jgi:hypothetical protein
MFLPAIQRLLDQLNKINISSPLTSSKLHRYEPLAMASSIPTKRTPEAPVGKTEQDFSEDVEASRSSTKQDEDTHIQRVEVTEEDVCPALQSVAVRTARAPLLTSALK